MPRTKSEREERGMLIGSLTKDGLEVRTAVCSITVDFEKQPMIIILHFIVRLRHSIRRACHRPGWFDSLRRVMTQIVATSAQANRLRPVN